MAEVEVIITSYILTDSSLSSEAGGHVCILDLDRRCVTNAMDCVPVLINICL